MRTSRIYLAPPNVGQEEKEMLSGVMDGGWISSVGPAIGEFEKKLEDVYLSRRVLALNSGTSALHLALILAEVGINDEVLVSSFTFIASANVVMYQGAKPIFVDSEQDSWNIDPDLLEQYLRKANSKPKALIATHLYGVPAQINRLKSICEEYNIVLIEDAAEAVGSSYEDIPLGSFGDYGTLSFNGNKIITTSGGGALIVNEANYDKGLHLSTQANSAKADYYHKETGYNYRLSNVLAGIGLVQLDRLDTFVKRKREIFDYYRRHLSDVFDFHSEISGSFSNRWLTTPTSKGDFDIRELIAHLNERNIETRRLWRPMHLQPVFEGFDCIENGVSEVLYKKGICLPSGTGLSENELNYIIKHVKSFFD